MGTAIEAKRQQTYRWNVIIFFTPHRYDLGCKNGDSFTTNSGVEIICVIVSKHVRAKFQALISLSPAQEHNIKVRSKMEAQQVIFVVARATDRSIHSQALATSTGEDVPVVVFTGFIIFQSCCIIRGTRFCERLRMFESVHSAFCVNMT